MRGGVGRRSEWTGEARQRRLLWWSGGLKILGPRLQITAITHAAGTATVHYTNTVPGTSYTLEYRTNLTAGIWQPVGTQPAPGESASQTDNSATGDRRFYRVFYPAK